MKKLVILVVFLALAAGTYFAIHKVANYSNANTDKKVEKQVDETAAAIADTIPK
jgi:hypothetical protein